MVDKIFDGTVNLLKKVSKKTWLSYKQVNVYSMIIVVSVLTGLTTVILIKTKN